MKPRRLLKKEIHALDASDLQAVRHAVTSYVNRDNRSGRTMKYLELALHLPPRTPDAEPVRRRGDDHTHRRTDPHAHHPGDQSLLTPTEPALIDVDDCEFRMLEPGEIKRGMAFDNEYVFLGSKRAQVRLAGNVVTPPGARDLIAAVAESLGMHLERAPVAYDLVA